MPRRFLDHFGGVLHGESARVVLHDRLNAATAEVIGSVRGLTAFLDRGASPK